MADRHNRTMYLGGCRCDQCKQAQSDYLKAYRRRKRAEAVGVAVVAPLEASGGAVSASSGSVVAAVEAELALLEHGQPGLAAAAVSMAKLLDDPLALPQQPSAARVLASLLSTLRKRPTQRGKLAVVRAMTERGGAGA